MENAYGVGVVNRYALFLDDDSDPLDALEQREAAKEKKKKLKTNQAEKENKGAPAPPAPKREPLGKQAPQQHQPLQHQRKGIKETQNNVKQDAGPIGGGGGGPKPQGQDRPKREPRPGDRIGDGRPQGPRDRPPRGRPDGQENHQDGPAGDQAQRPPRRDFGERKNFAEKRSFGDGERPERRPFAAGGEDREGGDRARHPKEKFDRGTRAPRGPGAKREFDRRSGSDRTGVKPVDKRDGGGAHNWGSHRDDVDDFNKTQSEGEQTDGEKGEPASPGAPAAAAAETQATPVEEEPKELTLDEWKALRSSRQKPQYNLRKAGEGEDLSRWKDMVALKKAKADGEDSDDEYDSAEYPQRVGRQKKVIGIEYAFYEPRRGGGGGGRGRGRGRGGPGAGGGGGRPRRERQPEEGGGGSGAGGGQGEEKPRYGKWQNAPKVDDSRDFPSLG